MTERELWVSRLHEVINDHFCDEFEHGESCKSCTAEFELCIPLMKLMYPELAVREEQRSE